MMAGYVDVGERLADIGADHAYLPLYLVREGVSPFVILTDIKTGPLEKARAGVDKAVKRGGPPDAYDLRLGDGLAVLAPAEVDTVVIAGLGGETIISILEADPEKTRSFSKFILQPRTRAKMLDAWLEGSCFKIIAKAKAEERGRLCDIIVCTPKEGKYD